MNIPQAKKKIRDLENSFIRDKKTGFISTCHWNKIVAEEIDKVNEFIQKEYQASNDIETMVRQKAHEVVMNYLTDGNPQADFKKSTIGADDFIHWYYIGFMDCLNKLNRHLPYVSKLALISDNLPVRET